MIRLKEKYSKAINLRKKGFSLNEISQRLKIAKSTAFLWLRHIDLPPIAIERLANRGLLGKVRSNETRRKRREAFERLLKEKTAELFKSISLTKNHQKILCALLFWCEGTKDIHSGIHFVNSDPSLIKTFLTFLRSAFNIREEKLRVSLHLHEYHLPRKQILFWSKVTSIPTSQFIKPYQKPHTAKRIRKDYPGCVNISYYDSSLAKELFFIAKETMNKYGGVG